MAPKANSQKNAIRRKDPLVTSLGVVAPPPIHVQTPTFEGSLATLFRFCQERKVDLMGIPLAPICEAYFSYLVTSESATLDEVAAALVALAYLLERKAWLLLPAEAEEPEEVPEQGALSSTAHEYQEVMAILNAWHEERAQLFFRAPGSGPGPYELPYVLEETKASDLALALERMLRRSQIEKVTPRLGLRRSLSDVIQHVLLAVTDKWRCIDDFFPERLSRIDTVYWFLALLELVRIGQIAARQAESSVEFSRAA